ncbi:hypothetical protein P1X14_11510 [Sphingomonas sp. AOB5]|uniref:hypothetical protein n=1 Tax=Sphingomonas sp. AOB5 TaxID=3034017 RepID=UPI0023F90AC2|nr:hypothetical protein [Sphingomonas sp. AOB5]MDF7775875.1 hypothetical protein [Sphingomonas sp. AOB5]
MIATLFSTLLLATPMASAQDAPAPVDRVICKRDNSVGTRLAKRTCMKESEWKQAEQRSRDDRNRILDNAEREGRNAETPYAKPS